MSRRKTVAAKDDLLGWFLRLLHHLGWPAGGVEDPQPLEDSGRGALAGTRHAVLVLPDGQSLQVVAVTGALEKMERAFAGYEDLNDLHRELHAVLRQRGIEPRLVVLLSGTGQGQLLDLLQEEVLLECNDRDELAERLLPIFETSALVRGSIVNLQRRPAWKRASELEKWVRVWETKLGAATGLPRAVMAPFFHWLLLARLAEETGLQVPAPCPFSRVGISPRSVPPARLLESAWVPLHRRHNLLQGAKLADILAIARHPQGQEVLSECLTSFSRLSRARFSADLFLEAFMDESWRQQAWRAAQVPPPGAGSEGPWQLAPWHWDADAEPVMPLLRAFDLVVEHAREQAIQMRAQKERGELAGVQLDVFSASAPPPAEEDAALFTLAEGLLLRTRDRARAAVLRLALLAHGVQWCARLGRRDPVFPVVTVKVEVAGAGAMAGTGAAVLKDSAPASTAAHLAALN